MTGVLNAVVAEAFEVIGAAVTLRKTVAVFDVPPGPSRVNVKEVGPVKLPLGVNVTVSPTTLVVPAPPVGCEALSV